MTEQPDFNAIGESGRGHLRAKNLRLVAIAKKCEIAGSPSVWIVCDTNINPCCSVSKRICEGATEKLTGASSVAVCKFNSPGNGGGHRPWKANHGPWEGRSLLVKLQPVQWRRTHQSAPKRHTHRLRIAAPRFAFHFESPNGRRARQTAHRPALDMRFAHTLDADGTTQADAVCGDRLRLRIPNPTWSQQQ